MAGTPGDAKLGAVGAYLLEFSQQIQQREVQEKHGSAKVIQLSLWPEAKQGGSLYSQLQILPSRVDKKGKPYL